ncbi:7-cyano-7-deazaguanine synthase QueC [Candidatus Latescibacterota bacterium]
MSDPVKKAVVLLSGGIDSTTTLAIAKHEDFEPCAMSFHYGQRHVRELESARRVCESMGIACRIELNIDLRSIGGSALTDTIDVPKGRTEDDITGEIPVTYVPARNTIFLSYALGWAEVLGAHDIYIGVNAVDFSGYPDCRPEFIEAFEQLANLATKTGVEGGRITIHTPLIHLTKGETIRTGAELGVDYSLTSSCYDPTPEGLACGKCDSCTLRLKGFSEAGYPDPIRYAG